MSSGVRTTIDSQRKFVLSGTNRANIKRTGTKVGSQDLRRANRDETWQIHVI